MGQWTTVLWDSNQNRFDLFSSFIHDRSELYVKSNKQYIDQVIKNAFHENACECGFNSLFLCSENFVGTSGLDYGFECISTQKSTVGLTRFGDFEWDLWESHTVQTENSLKIEICKCHMRQQIRQFIYWLRYIVQSIVHFDEKAKIKSVENDLSDFSDDWTKLSRFSGDAQKILMRKCCTLPSSCRCTTWELHWT